MLASQKMINELSATGFAKGALTELQCAVIHGSVEKTRQSLIYIKETVANHNKENPSDLLTMSSLLDKKISSLEVPNVTVLEYAQLSGSNEIAALLRSYGSKETGRTAYFPTFWNSINQSIESAKEAGSSFSLK